MGREAGTRRVRQAEALWGHIGKYYELAEDTFTEQRVADRLAGELRVGGWALGWELGEGGRQQAGMCA